MVLGNREPVDAIAARGGDEAEHFVCDMRLEPGGRLALRVVDAITSAPRPLLEVVLSRRGIKDRGALFTPEIPLKRILGLVTVDELPAGAWRVDVCVENGGWSMVEAQVEAGALTEALLLVGMGGAVAGRVDAEASLEGAWVALESDRTRSQPRTRGLRTGGSAAIDPATGGLRLDGLDPGDCTLTLEGSALSARAVATVLGGEESQVELDAQVPARLRIVSDVPWEGGTQRVRVRTGDLQSGFSDRTFATGAPVDFAVEAEPGHVRWEIERRVSSAIWIDAAPVARWSGEATLGVGGEHTVRLDPPR